ncbi:MAG: hypothetical protein V3T62_02415, partial [Alphaproteobacteria bacterium]
MAVGGEYGTNFDDLIAPAKRWSGADEWPNPQRCEDRMNAALDALHEDVFRKNMAPFWAVDTSADHDEDRQVMD